MDIFFDNITIIYLSILADQNAEFSTKSFKNFKAKLKRMLVFLILNQLKQ